MYQSFIGLEIHIQLATQTKIFCGCKAAFGDEPNSNICPVCMGYPGVLPVLNQEAMRMAYVVARTLNCTLSSRSVFERKNYFYPDLPKNYQISQYEHPLGRDGYIDIEFHKKKRRVRIHEVHLEEDAGKMIHAGDMSLLDYNRAGTPLLEIVTEPDLEVGEEAEVLLQQFRRMVRYLGVCDGNMEEGSMRCDANVSVNLSGGGLGDKVEIKNLNSSRFVRKALNFEISRQEDILERGGTVVQETRLWNENRDVSEAMRTKESAHDYRYFPEPDLPPFITDEAFLLDIEKGLVELPVDRRTRFIEEYGLSELQAEFLIDERSTADFFEETIKLGADPQSAASWLASDVKKLLNRRSESIDTSVLTPERFAELLRLLDEGRIHGKIAKQVLEEVFASDASPAAIIKTKGWEQITDPAELSEYINKVLDSHPNAVEQVRSGDAKPVGFLVGQVMKATSGRAEPQLLQELISACLSVKVIHVLSFGGAISGVRREDGLIGPGELFDLRTEFAGDTGLPAELRLEEIQLGAFLSEEIAPADWAVLISEIARRIEDSEAAGIVVAHGTDTLAYTASLLYWFFGKARIPIVLTASSVPNDSVRGSVKPRSEAVANISAAVKRAASGAAGVGVVYGEQVFQPLNLKFERVAEGADRAGVFRTWNEIPGAAGAAAAHAVAGTVAAGAAVAHMPAPIYPAAGVEPSKREAVQAALEAAMSRSFIVKTFPGMRGDHLITLMKNGVRYFVLELYDTGTASVRETPYSLREALQYGAANGVSFFCTSQQEAMVDFSDYVTSHELWREGAVPMGRLTTESAFTRLIVAQLGSEDERGVQQIMEDQ
ncbi:MAG: Asp-tRNA(Asn)/Glu-tRNA(Gln) amidotransferase subunit GatB [Spirochaetia bacterium]